VAKNLESRVERLEKEQDRRKVDADDLLTDEQRVEICKAIIWLYESHKPKDKILTEGEEWQLKVAKEFLERREREGKINSSGKAEDPL